MDSGANDPQTVNLNGVKVMVATDDRGFAILDVEQNGTAASIEAASEPVKITSTTVRTVDIYLYIDGESTAVYTNNIPNLGDASIDLSFSAA